MQFSLFYFHYSELNHFLCSLGWLFDWNSSFSFGYSTFIFLSFLILTIETKNEAFFAFGLLSSFSSHSFFIFCLCVVVELFLFCTISISIFAFDFFSTWTLLLPSFDSNLIGNSFFLLRSTHFFSLFENGVEKTFDRGFCYFCGKIAKLFFSSSSDCIEIHQHWLNIIEYHHILPEWHINVNFEMKTESINKTVQIHLISILFNAIFIEICMHI